MTTNNKEVSEKVQFPYKETDDVEVTYQLAIDYYSALHLAGHKIQLEWNGGGDSGSVWLKLDGEQIDPDYHATDLSLYDKIHAFVIDKMYDELDYGSWAGEFSASGTADFTIDGGFIGFQGVDHYSEDEYHTADLNFKVRVPKHLIPKDAGRLYISISGGYDEQDVNLHLSFRKTGEYVRMDLSKETEEYLFVIENDLKDKIHEVLKEHGGDHTYMDASLDITPGEDLVELLEDLEFYTVDERPKDIWINMLDRQLEDEQES